MGIREFLEKLRMKKAKYKEFEDDMDVQEKYYERKKSANQRDLERYEQEEYEKAVKERLEQYRKSRQKDIEFNHQILKTKDMFAGSKPTLLKEKKLFSSKSNLNTPGGLFWK